jgi:hypothetical protein
MQGDRTQRTNNRFLFGEGWDDNVGGLLQISCLAIRARHEERKDEGSLVSLNNSKPRWKL